MGKTGSEQLSSSSRLRSLIESADTTFLMEAHNALSAKIAEEAGFQALWASSLTISASMGLRDANELTWSESLDLVSIMIEGVHTPVLMDADSGYGSANIFSRFVRTACDRGVAGVCIEDKLFPKMNSFAPVTQELADIHTFCDKIAAAKDNQKSDEFMVVARTEAFVTGAGLSEALERADAYVNAGADAVLVQSKRTDASEILAFVNNWRGNKPVIVVPTTYPDTPVSELANAGISNIIWANHSLRASVQAMRTATKALFETQSANTIEGRIATIKDVFDLTSMDGLLASKEQTPKQSDD